MQIVLIVLACHAGLAVLWILMMYTKRQTTDFYGLADHSYAHRGLHDADKGVPENSMEAFRRAVQKGYGAELDVRITKDGHLVIMHDESLLRTTGVDREVHDCTLEELNAIRLSGNNEKIPLFREVLELFAGKAPLVIEIKTYKSNYAVLTAAVCKMLDEFPDLQYCIESFDPRVPFWLRRHRPDIIRGLLSLNFFRERNNQNAAVMVIMTNLLLNFLITPHFISYKFKHRNSLSLRICCKLWGVREFGWTVENDEEIREAVADNCVMIFEHCSPEK